jgi:hypothetical protein
MESAHPAMHRSIRSLGYSSERSCDHPVSEGDPVAALEVSALARHLPRDCRMSFAREGVGLPLWPVLWWVVVQFRTTTPASYVFVAVRKSSVKLAFPVGRGGRVA